MPLKTRRVVIMLCNVISEDIWSVVQEFSNKLHFSDHLHGNLNSCCSSNSQWTHGPWTLPRSYKHLGNRTTSIPANTVFVCRIGYKNYFVFFFKVSGISWIFFSISTEIFYHLCHAVTECTVWTPIDIRSDHKTFIYSTAHVMYAS